MILVVCSIQILPNVRTIFCMFILYTLSAAVFSINCLLKSLDSLMFSHCAMVDIDANRTYYNKGQQSQNIYFVPYLGNVLCNCIPHFHKVELYFAISFFLNFFQRYSFY